MNNAFGIPAWAMGIILVVLSTACVFGGIQRIAKVSSILVPVMAVLYFILAVVVIGMNISLIPKVIKLIVENAFGLQQFAGGSIGITMMNGIKRGSLFQ